MRLGYFSVITLCLLICCVPTDAGVTGAFSIVPGNVYAVIQGGIAEYTPTLVPVGTLQLSGVTVTEGVAFTPESNLVFSAFEGDQRDHVIEINSAGSIVHDLNLNIGSLDRASEGAVDSAGNIYEASTPNLQKISPNFSSFTTVPFTFSRSSGVTIGTNGLLYVTDQAKAKLVTFDSSLNVQNTVATKPTPTGLSFDKAGRLLLGEYDSNIGPLDVIDPVTGVETFIRNYTGISDVVGASDGSYYVSYNIGETIAHVSAQDVILSTVDTSNFSDSIAVAPSVPEPATDVMLLFGACAGCFRRRGRSPRGHEASI
jgi:hypothetical protein